MHYACQHSLRAVTGQSEVSLVSGETLRDRVWATYLLQAGRDLRVVQMGVVATLAADELKLACVSMLRLAANLAGVTEAPTLAGAPAATRNIAGQAAALGVLDRAHQGGKVCMCELAAAFDLT
jgi:hypothetical protein